MKLSHVLAALAGGTAVFAYTKYAKSDLSFEGLQKRYESHSDPRASLSSKAPAPEEEKTRTGSGLKDGKAKPGQTSDWYGHSEKGQS